MYLILIFSSNKIIMIKKKLIKLWIIITIIKARILIPKLINKQIIII